MSVHLSFCAEFKIFKISAIFSKARDGKSRKIECFRTVLDIDFSNPDTNAVGIAKYVIINF